MTTKELDQDTELLKFIRQHPESIEAHAYKLGRKTMALDLDKAIEQLRVKKED